MPVRKISEIVYTIRLYAPDLLTCPYSAAKLTSQKGITKGGFIITMDEKMEMTPETEEAVAQAAEPVDAEPAEQAKKPAKTKKPAYNSSWPKRVGKMLDDGNDMVEAVDPAEAQRREITEMQKHIKAKDILHARVYGVEPAKDGKAVTVVAKFGTLRVVFDAVDFFAYSNMKDMDKDDMTTRMQRYVRKGARMLNSVVSFIPVEIGKDGAGCPFVIGGRAIAMEALQDKYFFGEKALAEKGSQAKAVVLAAGPRYITVECLGVEAVMGSGSLSAFEFLSDVSERYKPGDGLYVIIEKLEIDKANRTVDVRFSHSLLERMTADVPEVSENMKHSRYIATVLHETDKYFIVCIDGLKVRGIVPKEYAKTTPGDPITVGCHVAMLVNNIDKERNMVIGSCMKVGE